MATYLLAYFGYEQWKSSETSNDTVAKVVEPNSNNCEIILDHLRKVNKKLLLIAIILLTIILLLMILKRLIKQQKYRKDQTYRHNISYNSNC